MRASDRQPEDEEGAMALVMVSSTEAGRRSRFLRRIVGAVAVAIVSSLSCCSCFCCIID